MISYRLEKSGQTWKVNLPESSGSDLLSVASSLTHDIDEIARKVEKGDYKNDKEAEDAFEARLAAAGCSGIRQDRLPDAQSGNASLKVRVRGRDSLAVERSSLKLVGGMTDKQDVEISDLIAEKLDAADLPEGARLVHFGTEKSIREYLYAWPDESVSSNARRGKPSQGVDHSNCDYDPTTRNSMVCGIVGRHGLLMMYTSLLPDRRTGKLFVTPPGFGVSIW